MFNKNLRIREFENLMLKDYTATKIQLYFAVEIAEDGYDPFETNLTPSNLNPKTIRGYLHNVTPEQLVYKQYGLSNIGAMEIVVDEKYYNWFKIANKIKIEDIDYRVLRKGNADGSKGDVIAKRVFKMVRIVLVRND